MCRQPDKVDGIGGLEPRTRCALNGRSKAVKVAEERNCDTSKVGMTMVHFISRHVDRGAVHGSRQFTSNDLATLRTADYNGASYLLAGKMGATDKYPVNLSMALSAASSAMTLCLPSFNVSGAVPSINPS